MESKGELLEILIKDTDTNKIICSYPPTRYGKKRAAKLKGLAGIEVIMKYSLGGETYECN